MSRGYDPPRMPTFDYWQLVPSRRRLELMPMLPTPVVPSTVPPLEPLGTSRCYTGFCVRCGRTLISATGRIAPGGTVCHHACDGRRR